MRCPTCGETVMIHGGYWECGWCGDCGTLRRCQQPIPEKIEEELPELTPESLAATADPDTALLLRKFSEYLSAWDMDELSAMGASEIIERAYGEDQETGIAMWGTLLRTAGSRLKSPREAEWLLHTCCPYGEDDFCETLLDELARNEKLVCCILQSAYVGAEQYHLIDAAAESGRPELMARFMAALGGNTFPRKKWEVPYQEFEELCAARSRETVSEQENTEKISDAEKTDMPRAVSAERKKSSSGVIIAFAVLVMLCVGIFASLRWNTTVQSHDNPVPPTTNSTDLKTQNSRVNKEKVDAQQTEKERYSGKLPVEGMPVRCLQYTTLGAPDKRLDCKNFDRLELGQKYFNVYWYDENGEIIAAGMCAQWKNDSEFMLKSFSQYYPGQKGETQTADSGNFSDTGPGSGASLREDYDDPEDLYEDGDYEDLDEAWDEWEEGW